MLACVSDDAARTPTVRTGWDFSRQLGPARRSGHVALIPIGDVAEFLGTSERHVRRLVFERRIPYLKVGGLLRFDPLELADWLDRARVPATP